MAKMLRCRVRYFTDGAVIGSKEFVNEAFAGARRMRGNEGDTMEYAGSAGGDWLNPLNRLRNIIVIDQDAAAL